MTGSLRSELLCHRQGTAAARSARCPERELTWAGAARRIGADLPGAVQCSVLQREPPADAQIRDLLIWSSAWRSGLDSAGQLPPGGGPPIIQYRGLRPDPRLMMTLNSQAFELAFKRRELESGPEVYRACVAPQRTISRLYRQAGIKLGS